MSGSREQGGVEEEVPEAVMEWLSSEAAERGVSEAELLRSLLAGGEAPSSADAVTDDDLERVERKFRSLVEDVRERIVQVKREADEKAPADHSHRDLRSTLEQLGREVGTLEAEVERLEERLEGGFENYEEILTYLTETTDSLDRNLGRLASAVIDLRDRVDVITRDEARRSVLAHLTDTANRNGVEKAKCEECGEGVNVGMLVEPRCPHCDASFSGLEPKGGFFRKSVLHTGRRPALESGPGGDDAVGTLEAMVESGERAGEGVPSFDVEEAEEESVGASEAIVATDGSTEAAEPAPAAGWEGEAMTDGHRELEAVSGIGPAYADRLEAAGITGLPALAVADPGQLGAVIDVPEKTVADWVEQAGAMTAS